MQQITSSILAANLDAHLSSEQRKVDAQVSFATRAAKAKSLWDNKNSTLSKKTKFEAIYQTLAGMCISVGICNYCEANEANDIEHIYPKAFFPERAFVWENYLLACKSCNTHWKLDKCYILAGCASTILARGAAPAAGSEIAFINPRVENPNEYWYYDTLTHTFVIWPDTHIECEAQEKAKRTLEILGLNIRDTLLHSRRAAYNGFFDMLSRLQRAKQATTHDELAACFYPDGSDFVDFARAVADQQIDFENSIRQAIQKSRHQTVWYAIKTYCKNQPRWKPVFDVIPAAADW